MVILHNDAIPAGVPVISRSGHTLLPGLIDAHIHASGGDIVLPLEQSWRFGVNTVMGMHNEPDVVASLKKLAKERSDLADFMSSMSVKDGREWMACSGHYWL
jgi:imidazolonepropionase-like amidohydrolase